MIEGSISYDINKDSRNPLILTPSLFNQYLTLSNNELEALIIPKSAVKDEYLRSITLLKDDIAVKGKVYRLRKLSKKLRFIEIELNSESKKQEREGDHLIEIKLSKFEMEEEYFNLIESIKLGDFIEVIGKLEKLNSKEEIEEKGKKRFMDFYLMHANRFAIIKKRSWYPPCLTENNRDLKKHLDYFKGFEKDSNIIDQESNIENKNTVCKFYLNNGKCPKGRPCKFWHPKGDELIALRKDYVDERKQIKGTSLNQSSLLVKEDNKENHFENCHSKTQKVEIFGKFLIHTYGSEALSQGSGILEVGGGRGDLAFELHTKLNIPYTQIEPRPPKPTKQQLRYFAANPNASSPIHISEYFTNTTPQYNISPSPYAIIIGLHPDEATNVILTYALKHNLPFALVPCCVFANQFDRNIKGEKIVTYEQLVKWIEYIANKDENYTRKCFKKRLGFKGRDWVIYSI